MSDDIDRLNATITTLEQLLGVFEEVAQRQSRRYEAAHQDALRRAEELERSRAALAQSELRKSAMVEASLDAIITIDEAGIVTEFSASAEQIFGHAREDAIGRELADLVIPEDLRASHREGIKHYLATGEGPVLNRRVELPAVRKGGESFPVELTIVPVHQDGELFFTGFVRDITEQRRAAERIQHLQAISDSALSSLAMDELLPALLDRVQDVLAPDTIGIMLLNADGELELRAGRGLEASQDEGYRLPIGAGIAGRVARDRRRAIVPDVRLVHDAHPILARAGVVSLVAVPLVSAGTLLGVLHVGAKRRRTFHDDDADLLQRIGDRIAMAIEHAALYEREQRIATTLQLSLLPERAPSVPGFDISLHYLPAGDGTKVGGDWYDAILLPDGRVGLAIGDVVGRGVRAAAVMGQLRYALRAYAFDGESPDAVLARLDRLIFRSELPEMATMLYAVFDPQSGALAWASAGHPPPLLVAGSDRRFLDGLAGVPVGITGEGRYERHETLVPEGGMLVLYTDGLVERRAEDIDAGLNRLAAAVHADGRAPADVGADVLRAMFDGRPPKDDVAFMIVRYDPSHRGQERTSGQSRRRARV